MRNITTSFSLFCFALISICNNAQKITRVNHTKMAYESSEWGSGSLSRGTLLTERENSESPLHIFLSFSALILSWIAQVHVGGRDILPV